MKAFYLFPLLIVLVSACTHKNQPAGKRDTSSAIKPKRDSLLATPRADTTSRVDTVVDTTKKLLQYRCRHIFSDPAVNDSLVLTLYGKQIENANFVFEVWNAAGKSLFRQVFSSYDLVIDMNGESIAKKQDSVKNYAARFFDPTNFSTPAIDPTEKLDDDFDFATDRSERKGWEQIKADPTAVGFLYNYGYESTATIAWSKKAKKVFTVFYSD